MKTLYADHDLDAEYIAGAWAAALQAHRRIKWLAVFVGGVLTPLCVYLVVRGMR